MALPDSGVSISVAMHARIFLRRVEEALKTSAAFNCLADSPLMRAPRFTPTGVSFRKGEGQVQCVLRLDGRATLLLLIPAELALDIAVTVSALSTGDRGLAGELNLTYAGFDLWIIDSNGQLAALELSDEQQADLDAEIAAMIEDALSGLAVTLDFTPLLGAEREIISNPSLTIGPPDAQDISDTLLLGVEVDGDEGVDRSFFRNSYEADSLGDRDWALEIDASLFTETVQEKLADLELEGKVEGWADTDEVSAFWSNAEVPEPDFGQAPAIEAIADQHPIWIILEGDFTVFEGWGNGEVLGSVELGSWAVAFADLAVAEGKIVAIPGLLSGGYGVFAIDVSDADLEAVEVASADFEGGLRLEGFAFDADRLVLLGVDDHQGLPGGPEVVPPEQVSVTLVWQEIGSGMCTGQVALGNLTADGAVLSRPAVANTGSAPLWVCKATIDDDDAGVFSVVGPALPLRIDAGESKRIHVAMAVDDGDDAEYTATLRLGINQMDRPFVSIAVSGHREPQPDFTRVRPQLCLRPPEHIPPQEWFDDLRGWLGKPQVLLDDKPGPEDVLVAVLAGLPVEAILVATDRSGELVDVGVGIGGRHTIVVPASGAQVGVLGSGRAEFGRLAGAWLRTATWAPIDDWSTDQDVVAVAVTESTAVVLTTAGLAFVPLAGGRVREVDLKGGRDVVALRNRALVLTDSELLLLDEDRVQDRAEMRRVDRLVTLRDGVLGVGTEAVVAAELGPKGLALDSPKVVGGVRGIVPISDGLAVVGDRTALIIDAPGIRGLANARETELTALEPHVGDWLKVGAPDVARLAAARQVTLLERRGGRKALARLGPSRLGLRPPS